MFVFTKNYSNLISPETHVKYDGATDNVDTDAEVMGFSST